MKRECTRTITLPDGTALERTKDNVARFNKAVTADKKSEAKKAAGAKETEATTTPAPTKPEAE